MKEITENKDGVKVYVGSEATILADAEGKVLHQRAAGTRPTMTISPAANTVKVGTDKEIAAEKVAQDAKLAVKVIVK